MGGNFTTNFGSLLTRYPKTSVLADMVSRQQEGILLEAGADVDALDQWNRTAVQLTDNPQITAHLVAADYSGQTLIHSTLSEDKSTSYLLSLRQIVDCKPFPWHSLCYPLQRLLWINSHWRLFKRRVPFKDFQRMMNLHPAQGISPLCRAAAIDALDIIDRCLEMGASIDFEGSSYGSALMAACTNCRLKAVKHLVRRGASIVYHGELGLTSAIEMANGHEKIIRWLLVGQFSEQAKLEYCTSQDLNNSPPLRDWSGIQEVSMRLTGYRERRPEESLWSYIFRLSEIRRAMRGQVLPLHQRDPLAGPPNTVRYQI
ncbi:hypothetical protein GGR58DRAFT_521197 [Xylaria digitata]|nr:hypothetical protein GGR58DRAFT_521197 [Xylaria digitata]